jgi:hypothetical protein
MPANIIKTRQRKVTVLKRLNDLIIPLSKEELGLLEKSILTEGCRDALIVWVHDGREILVDGHNRYRICSAHNIPFKVHRMHFNNEEAVRIWMVDNQMAGVT